jgi:hypothetical protein
MKLVDYKKNAPISLKSTIHLPSITSKHKSKKPGWWARNWRGVLFFSLAGIIIGGGVIFALVYGYNSFLTLMYITDAKDLERWGRFGDYVGGLSRAFFNFWGFFLLLFTIVLQIQEMKFSRREIKKTTEALQKRQAKQESESLFNSSATLRLKKKIEPIVSKNKFIKTVENKKFKNTGN